MKIIFAGTPVFAARHLATLIDSEHDILAVYTQPDRPAGRGKKLTPSPVKALAMEHDIPVHQPISLKDKIPQQTLAELNADIMVVVAYGLLLPQAVLNAPKHGCINVHASLLPRWRGAAPIQRAIEAGDTTTGITIMQMDRGLDTGDMLLIRECPILPSDTAGDLHDRLINLGPPALLEALDEINQKRSQAQKQDDTLSNYATKIEKAEARINWQAPSHEIARKIRAFNPFPVSFTELKGERIKIHSAHPSTAPASKAPGTVTIEGKDIIVHCGEGSLIIDHLQLPGKKACDAATFLNGFAHLLADEPQLGGA